MSTIGECINKMWYDLTVEFYLAIKRNLFFEKKLLSTRSQPQKVAYYPHISRISKSLETESRNV